MSAVSAYCSAQDVVSTLPRLLGSARSSTSSLSTEKLTEIVENISAEMDSRFLPLGYTVPIDTSGNERVRKNLNRIAVLGSAAQALRSIYKTGDVNFDLADTYERQYYRDITLIEENGFGEDIDKTETEAPATAPPEVGPVYKPTFGVDKRIV